MTKRSGLNLTAFTACMLLVSQAGAQYKVLLPGCCTSVGTVFVLNSRTGGMERALTTGSSSSAYVSVTAAATLKSGLLAVLNFLDTSAGISTTFSIVNPSTGALVGTLSIAGLPWTVAVNPVSGVVYAGYSTPSGSFIEEINPSTLQVIKTGAVAAGSTFVVSPDGKRIYITGYGTGVSAYSTSTLEKIGAILGPDLVIGLSPDSETLYAASDASGINPNSVFLVNTHNLEITKTISLASFGNLGAGLGYEYGGGAVSSDGTQVYLNFSTSIVTLNVSTLAIVSTPLPGTDLCQQVVTTPSGSVYVGGIDGFENIAMVFDPSAQTFSTQFPLIGPGHLIGSAGGAQLFLVTEGSPLSVPAAAPSTTIDATVIGGAGAGFLYSAYDATDNLVLLPDANGDMEVLDGSTLRLKSTFPVGFQGSTTYGQSGYMGSFTYTTSLLGQIIQFDPLTQTVTGSVRVPTDPGDNTGTFEQITAVGNTLYAPYVFLYTAADAVGQKPATAQGTGSLMAVVDTSTFKLSALYPISTGLVYGFAIPQGSSAGYLSVLQRDGDAIAELIEIDLSTGTKTKTVPIEGWGSLLASPDGSTLYMYGSALLYAIDVQTLAVTNSAALACTGLAITPDGDYLYCITGSGVDILSTSTLGILGSISTGAVGAVVGPPIVITK